MRNLYIFLIIILFSVNKLFAQADTSKKSSDRINVFDRNSKGSSTVTSNDLNGNSINKKKLNAIKINPFLLANGEIPIFFEQELGGSDFTVQAGLGLTFKDYLTNFYGDDAGFLSPPAGLSNSSALWKTGVCFNAGIRYYFNDVMDGLYFSADAGYRSNPIQYPIIIYNTYGQQTNTGTTYYSGSYHNIDFKILIGGEHDLFDIDHLLVGWYAGVGLRSYTVNYYDGTQTPAILTNNTLKPRVYCGCSIGYCFNKY